ATNRGAPLPPHLSPRVPISVQLDLVPVIILLRLPVLLARVGRRRAKAQPAELVRHLQVLMNPIPLPPPLPRRRLNPEMRAMTRRAVSSTAVLTGVIARPPTIRRRRAIIVAASGATTTMQIDTEARGTSRFA